VDPQLSLWARISMLRMSPPQGGLQPLPTE
jgi:hypothetical protein